MIHPTSATPKPHALSQHETRQRKQSINKEIKRIEAGGAVDEQFVDQLGKVRSDNQHLIRLLQVIEENR